MDEMIKTWPLRFPTNMEKGLFVWPIVSQYVVKVRYIGWFLEKSRLLFILVRVELRSSLNQ